MKTKTLTALLMTVCSLPLLAQGPPQGPPPEPITTALDKNRDGELSRAEIRSAVKSLLKLDKDKNGTLSSEELRPKPPKKRRRRSDDDENAQPPQGPPPSNIMTALDTNEDGELSEEELDLAAESLLKLDADENGKLSREESGIKRPGGPGGQGGGPGGQGGPPPRGPRR